LVPNTDEFPDRRFDHRSPGSRDLWLSVKAAGSSGRGELVRRETVRGEVTGSADARELRKEIRRRRGRIDELESGE
jgi:hypothetical protein